MAAASSCAGSRVATSQSDTESVASATRGVEAGPGRRGSTTSWSRGSPGEGRGGAAAHHLRGDVLAQATVSSAAWHLPPLNTVVECSPEVEVASGPAPTGLHVSRSHYLVSGWIDKRNSFFILTPCAPDFFPGDHHASRRSCPRPPFGDECGACVVVVPCLHRISNSIDSGHTSGDVDEGGERGRSEGVGCVGGAVLANSTERRIFGCHCVPG